ncbi:unnamed protein product [Rotaria sp. Silwood1]|nr:unnamed protein product [Rotaria sp. Silwood1]
MDQYLIQKFGLVSDINDFTPIDEFKVFRNFDAFTDALNEYPSSHELTDLEQYFFKIQTDPRRRFLYRLSQNYFDNYFLHIHFILPNPVLITKPTFANLYHNRNLLPVITDHIIELYETTDSEAAHFNNKLLLDKFANNLDFVSLPGDYHGTDYGMYFEQFPNETARLKAYIINLAKDPKWIEHPEQGLSQFDPSIYQFAFEHYTGLASVSTDEFPKIKQWAQKHLDYLMEEVNLTCNRLLTDPKDKEKSTYETMIIIGKHPSQQ